jgi:hypothetical protein
VFNGQTVQHGQSITAYLQSTAPAGDSCVPESRTCSNGVLSGSHTYATCQAAPAAPTNVQAVLGAPGTGQATVSWTPSATSATSALAGYTVAGGGSGCTAGPGDSSCVVTGLANGTAYSFTVTAANAEGATAVSAGSNPVTPLGVNAITFPPQAGQTYAMGGSFAINPVATGLSTAPLTYSSLSTGICTVSGSTVTMVSAGVCTLAANQTADDNWAAAPQATQTVQITATAPGAPTGVTATPSGPTQVTVRWTPPANDGGGITQYTVRALVNGQPSGQTCTAVPPVTQCTVTGLEPGKTYTFAVEATNGAGNTAAPAPTNPATPLADAKAFSAAAPTGTGTVAVAVAGGGNTCAFESVQLLPAASAGAPATRSFPHGVLDFVLNGCDATPVTLTVTYPPGTPLQGAQYWKRQGGAWGPFASAMLGVNTAVLTLVDGGTGDDDGAADGRIVDPGGVALLAAPGPGGTATAIPTLGEWALALLAAVLGLLGVWQRRPVRA